MARAVRFLLASLGFMAFASPVAAENWVSFGDPWIWDDLDSVARNGSLVTWNTQHSYQSGVSPTIAGGGGPARVGIDCSTRQWYDVGSDGIFGPAETDFLVSATRQDYVYFCGPSSTPPLGAAAPSASLPSSSCGNYSADPAQQVSDCTSIIWSSIAPGDALADVFFHRSVGHFQQQNFPLAIADVDRAIELRPRDSRYFDQRCGLRTLARDRIDLAVADCTESIRLGPGVAGPHHQRGLAHMLRGDPASALADFEAALQIAPDLNAALYMRGIAKLRLGQTSGGRVDVNAAIARDSNIDDAFAGWGFSP